MTNDPQSFNLEYVEVLKTNLDVLTISAAELIQMRWQKQPKLELQWKYFVLLDKPFIAWPVFSDPLWVQDSKLEDIKRQTELISVVGVAWSGSTIKSLHKLAAILQDPRDMQHFIKNVRRAIGWCEDRKEGILRHEKEIEAQRSISRYAKAKAFLDAEKVLIGMSKIKQIAL